MKKENNIQQKNSYVSNPSVSSPDSPSTDDGINGVNHIKKLSYKGMGSVDSD